MNIESYMYVILYWFSNRHVLDFDFEKLCSVSLSHINVYACLVCGKYFQGKDIDFALSNWSFKLISLTNKYNITHVSLIFSFVGRGRRSHAYTHSVQVDHHVFLNLRTLKVTFSSKRRGNEW